MAKDARGSAKKVGKDIRIRRRRTGVQRQISSHLPGRENLRDRPQAWLQRPKYMRTSLRAWVPSGGRGGLKPQGPIGERTQRKVGLEDGIGLPASFPWRV